jgi:hypothetical protein
MYQLPDIRQYKDVTERDRPAESVKIGQSKRIIFINKAREEVFMEIAGKVQRSIERSAQQRNERKSKRLLR